MVQKQSDGTMPSTHQVPAEREARTVPLHNPATQQMLVVGKRREEAEAKLEQRLHKSKQMPEASTG
ncbi:hypothetical protein J2Y66_003652 [Paenarthrobacter nitroguajacolicus]|uniref:hypothetical protein n=1 Tax=Paenarthrobacter nitroguajacolicus TaxID=211146 RepID=UPI002858ADC8|nr:hypothetical protein [Paenarthrobacter nitroguajacolicus]MDR6989137.1 hypothetical protein [Paenarthrobacter nitroguajacolicus]